MLGRRALSSGRLAALGATADFYHGPQRSLRTPWRPDGSYASRLGVSNSKAADTVSFGPASPFSASLLGWYDRSS